MEFLRQEVKTFKGTDSEVVGQEFAGSLWHLVCVQE